ncbi:putative DD41D transposase [Trichonephila clavipes]|nr:putative DD41D transposase [Trichonephila clavipes]
MILDVNGTIPQTDKDTANILGEHCQKISNLDFCKVDGSVKRRARNIVHGCRSNTNHQNYLFAKDFSMQELGALYVILTFASPLVRMKFTAKLGRLPRNWKCPTVFPIRKPQKDARFPEGYKPIALTSISCLKKALLIPGSNVILILSDSRNIIQHLSIRYTVDDNTGVAILEKLKCFSSSRENHLQSIPSHVNIMGNEIVDSLTKDGAALPTMNSTPLTYSELHSTYINNKQSTVHPAYRCCNNFCTWSLSTCKGVTDLSGVLGHRVPSFRVSTAPLKFPRVEKLRHVKTVEAQSPPVGVVWRFVEWAQNEIAVVPDFHKRILFSDEAHFWLNGYVNKQNCRIWSEANPQVYVETPLHPEKLTVWCALWAGGIIGPYFFKNDEGHNVTVNGDRYRAMITNFFIPELNNHDVQELWFQQDGATSHTARATIDLLKDTFGGRLISRFRPVNWSPRSCDLTPLDYFLWGYVKSLVYADKPQTLDHLEDNIRRVIADIRPQILENSSKIGRPDWTTSEPAVAVLCQKSNLKCNGTRLSFE